MAICDNKQVSTSFLFASPCCFVIMNGGGRAHKNVAQGGTSTLLLKRRRDHAVFC